MAAALRGPVSPLFGIGLYAEGAKQVPFEIGWAEFERDVRWAHRVLATWNIGKADRVLVSTPNFEGPWSSPLVKALRELEAPHSNAEPYGWDVRRSATFLRLLRFKAFIAVSGEVATGLLREPGGAGLLGAVELIWARPDAIAPLREAGLEPALFAMLGPALGLECPQRSGVHLDPAEWRLSQGLTLSTVGARAHTVRDLPVGLPGQVEDTPCPCGLPGPRLRVAETR